MMVDPAKPAPLVPQAMLEVAHRFPDHGLEARSACLRGEAQDEFSCGEGGCPGLALKNRGRFGGKPGSFSQLCRGYLLWMSFLAVVGLMMVASMNSSVQKLLGVATIMQAPALPLHPLLMASKTAAVQMSSVQQTLVLLVGVPATSFQVETKRRPTMAHRNRFFRGCSGALLANPEQSLREAWTLNSRILEELLALASNATRRQKLNGFSLWCTPIGKCTFQLIKLVSSLSTTDGLEPDETMISPRWFRISDLVCSGFTYEMDVQP